MALKFYSSVAKGLNLKVRKFFQTFVEITEEKLVERGLFDPHMNRINCSSLAVGLHDIATLGYNYEKLIKEPQLVFKVFANA